MAGYHGAVRPVVSLALALALPGAASAGPVRPPPDSAGLAAARALSAAQEELARAMLPTVVLIESHRESGGSPGLGELGRAYRLPRPGERAGAVPSTGSGVLIAEGGLVLTNHHVVGSARTAVVTLADRRSFHAEVLASDPRTDLALLRVRSDTALPWAELAADAAPQPGQLVMAIGHPYDFPFTVGFGTISATGRRNLFRNEIQDYLQLDVAISPGSSGGPLFDLDGRVVGLNTAVFSEQGSETPGAGLSFAIPASMARRVVDELLARGEVPRASLGLSVRDQPASTEDPQPGARVVRVMPGGPAAQAGLRVGDVVRRIDGEPVLDGEDLRALVLARGVGVALRLEVEREGRSLELKAKTVDEAQGLRTPGPPAKGSEEVCGLRLGALDPAGARVFGLPEPLPEGGLLVWSVDVKGRCGALGLRPGDVLVSLGGQALEGLEVAKAVLAAPRPGALRLWRDGELLWLPIVGSP